MGQYHYVVNLDKRQFLMPHRFGDGLKLLEFASSSYGTLAALALVLAASTDGGQGRGGGDPHEPHPLIGSWAGDRLAIVGDYAEDAALSGRLGIEDPPASTIYTLCYSPRSERSPEEYCATQREHAREMTEKGYYAPEDPGTKLRLNLQPQHLFTDISEMIRPAVEANLGVRFQPPSYSRGDWGAWLERAEV